MSRPASALSPTTAIEQARRPRHHERSRGEASPGRSGSLMETGAFQGLRILVLDDELRNIDVLQRLLARAGYKQVRATTDAVEALAMFREQSPDLILLDLHMPVMDGFGVM